MPQSITSLIIPLMCIVYRARNGFGGYNHDVSEYTGGKDFSMGFRCAGIERIWIALSKRRGFVDLTDDYFKAVAEKRQ
jgi:hypothetical protein